MDNLTHSVTGLAVGEFIHRSLPQESNHEHQGIRRRLLLSSCAVASNFPDLDIFLSKLLPAPLGYLLHHRGHTHTFLYVIPQALLVALIFWLCWPAARRLLKESANARIGLVLALGFGLALHVMMDFLNSYGVHPFHPFDSRWFFGDMVFIVEPLFWMGFGIPLALMIQRRWLKFILIATLIGIPLYFTTKAYLSWMSLGLLLVVALIVGSIQVKSDLRGKGALGFAAIIIASFISIQSFASREVKSEVTQFIKSKNPTSRVLDIATTAFPANPFCWTFLSIESDENAGVYRLRRGTLSLIPKTLPLNQCPASLSGIPAKPEITTAITVLLEKEGSLLTLRNLAKNNCYFEAWLRFVRAPFVEQNQAVDLRFSSSPRGNFTTIDLDAFNGHACLNNIPEWELPRKDLLTPINSH